MRHSRTLPLLVLLLANLGCSFMAVRPSPQWDESTGRGECAGGGWIVADVAGALLAAGLASISGIHPFAGLCSLSNHSCPTDTPVSPSAYIPAAVLGASAIYGGIATAVCRSAPPLKQNPVAPPIPIPDEPRSQP
jgi:hypothetical protein